MSEVYRTVRDLQMSWVHSDEEAVEAAVVDPSRRKTFYGTLTNQVGGLGAREVWSRKGMKDIFAPMYASVGLCA
jgi:hypothetical protein